MDLLTRLDGDKSKINACKIKEDSEYLTEQLPSEFVKHQLKGLEVILPTRLSDETSRGILNIARATPSNTAIDEIEKALVSTCNHFFLRSYT